MLDAKAFAGELAALTKTAIAKAVDPLILRIVELEKRLALFELSNGLEKRLADMEHRQGLESENVKRLLEE